MDVVGGRSPQFIFPQFLSPIFTNRTHSQALDPLTPANGDDDAAKAHLLINQTHYFSHKTHFLILPSPPPTSGVDMDSVTARFYCPFVCGTAVVIIIRSSRSHKSKYLNLTELLRRSVQINWNLQGAFHSPHLQYKTLFLKYWGIDTCCGWFVLFYYREMAILCQQEIKTINSWIVMVEMCEEMLTYNISHDLLNDKNKRLPRNISQPFVSHPLNLLKDNAPS